MIDTSAQRQKELFLPAVFFSSEQEASAYTFYVRARYAFLTETLTGIEELVSCTPIESNYLIIKDMILQPTQNNAKAMAYTYKFVAETEAHKYVRQYFLEVWANRKTPEYEPPWDRAFDFYINSIPQEQQREMSE